MKRTLLIAVACVFLASPAMADLFDFDYTSLLTSYNGTTFTANVQNGRTIGTVNRYDQAVNANAFFDTTWPKDLLNKENFNITMGISNVGAPVAGQANGDGTFTLTDKDGDTISGLVNGIWTDGVAATFVGDLSIVTFTDVGTADGFFNGDSGTAMSMTFNVPQPWQGILIELAPGTIRGHHLWFDKLWYNAPGGSAEGTIVPLPGAVLLGLLGLGAAGLRLRKVV